MGAAVSQRGLQAGQGHLSYMALAPRRHQDRQTNSSVSDIHFFKGRENFPFCVRDLSPLYIIDPANCLILCRVSVCGYKPLDIKVRLRML